MANCEHDWVEEVRSTQDGAVTRIACRRCCFSVGLSHEPPSRETIDRIKASANEMRERIKRYSRQVVGST